MQTAKDIMTADVTSLSPEMPLDEMESAAPVLRREIHPHHEPAIRWIAGPIPADPPIPVLELQGRRAKSQPPEPTVRRADQVAHLNPHQRSGVTGHSRPLLLGERQV